MRFQLNITECYISETTELYPRGVNDGVRTRDPRPAEPQSAALPTELQSPS